uniref:Uncharacterized protein n=1 Tax=Parastrongyloides trichosuri TaxID=131310 RepID=A0A0N4ZSR1_PARTI
MKLYLLSHLLIFLLFIQSYGEENLENDESDEEEEINNIRLTNNMDKYYEYLYKKMIVNGVKTDEKAKEIPLQKQLPDSPKINTDIEIPGPFDPLPGRTYDKNFMAMYPFASQYVGGFDYDPLEGRHFGGNLGVSIPSWGFMDVQGNIRKRWHDTTGKFGYIAHPVNMLGFDKKDYIQIINNPSLNHNRGLQPTIGLGKIPRNYVPISCKAPLCNPYISTFGVGVDMDGGGTDGYNGDFQFDLPISKGIAYQIPIGGNIYYDIDNTTMTYSQHLSPIDPYNILFPTNKYPTRRKRNLIYYNINKNENIYNKNSVFTLKNKEIPFIHKYTSKPIYPALLLWKIILKENIRKNFLRLSDIIVKPSKMFNINNYYQYQSFHEGFHY